MKRWLVFAPVLLVTGGLAACGGSGESPDGGTDRPLSVVATTVQIAALAGEVAGDRAEIVSIIPAGSDPHEFEPTASDLRAIADADLVLRHGVGLDTFLDDAVEGAGVPVVTVTDGLPLEPPALEDGHEDEDGEHGEEGHEHSGEALDPHVWHDPALAGAMVEKIRDALIDADPAGADAYRANAEAYIQVLEETDAEIRALIDAVPRENRKLVTNHDAFGYFARAYGLEVVGAVIPGGGTGAEPSAAEAAALLQVIKEEGVKAIFAESSVNPELARQLASDAGVEIVDDLYGDTLGEPGTPEATVHGMLLHNAKLIADALR